MFSLFCWPSINFRRKRLLFIKCWLFLYFADPPSLLTKPLLFIKLWRTWGGGDLASKTPAWSLTKWEFLEHIKTNRRLAVRFPFLDLNLIEPTVWSKTNEFDYKQDKKTSKSAIRLRNINIFFKSTIFRILYALASIKFWSFYSTD